MKKVFSKWVPRLLTPEQNQQRIDESKSCLDMFTRNKSEFLRRYITMDETWIHHFTPESNRQSAEWHAAGESRPKRPKTQQLAGKVMASVFWDAHGIIFIDYLQKGQTINSDYYMALLERLKDEIAKKRPHMAKKKVLFHQDNAPCHKSMKTMAKLNELGFELLPHPPYSPDLAPSDYWLFADLKKMLREAIADLARSLNLKSKDGEGFLKPRLLVTVNGLPASLSPTGCQRFGHSLRKCTDAEPACLKCARSCFNCKGDHPAFWDRRPTLLEALRTRGLSRRSPRSKSAIQSVGLLTSQSFQGSRIQRMLFSNTLPAAQVLSPAYQVLPPSAQDQPLASQVQPPAEYLDMEDDLDDFCDLVPIL
ncbi:hypothetical protein ACLKA6_000684 [Drosophila palustris]